MAGKNIDQLYVARPATSFQNTDLFYLGRFPYDNTDDYAYSWATLLQATTGGAISSISASTTLTGPFPQRVVCNTNSGVIILTLSDFATNGVVLGQIIEVVNVGSGSNVVRIHNAGGFQIASDIKPSAKSLFRVSGIGPDSLDNLYLGQISKYDIGDTVQIDISGNATTANSATTATTATTAANLSGSITESQVTGLTADLAGKQPLDANLTALAGLGSATRGPIYKTGTASYNVGSGKTFAGTAFNNLTQTANAGDQFDFTSASAKTVTLDGTGLGVGYEYYSINSGAGALTFTTTGGYTLYGPTSFPGATNILIKISLQEINATVVFVVESAGIFTTFNAQNLLNNEYSGTSQNVVLADAFKNNYCSNASAITITVQPNSMVSLPDGFIANYYQKGAGQITFAAGAGVTINSRGAMLKTFGQYSAASLVKETGNIWYLSGDLST